MKYFTSYKPEMKKDGIKVGDLKIKMPKKIKQLKKV